MRCLLCNEIIDEYWIMLHNDEECQACYEIRTGFNYADREAAHYIEEWERRDTHESP